MAARSLLGSSSGKATLVTLLNMLLAQARSIGFACIFRILKLESWTKCFRAQAWPKWAVGCMRPMPAHDCMRKKGWTSHLADLKVETPQSMKCKAGNCSSLPVHLAAQKITIYRSLRKESAGYNSSKDQLTIVKPRNFRLETLALSDCRVRAVSTCTESTGRERAHSR